MNFDNIIIVQDQIKQLNIRLKQSDSRSEYAEMNISKLHHRYNFFINGNVKQCKKYVAKRILSHLQSIMYYVFQDRRAGGRDHQGEVEDQRGLRPA